MLKEEKLPQDSIQTQLAQPAAQLSAQEYLDMQGILHEINVELFRIDDLDKLYRTAVELAHTRLGFERVGMYLLNEAKDLLLGTYGTDAEGNVGNEQGPENVIDQKETIDTFVLGRNRLVVEEDADLWSGGEVVGRGWHIGAAMWIEDSPIGVIFADNLLTGQPLKPYQSELLFAYAGIVSNLIERNRFETIITKRAAEMQAVAEVSTAAATILNTGELLQEVVNLTKNRFDLYHTHIYLLDTETEMLVLTSGAGTVGQQMVAERRQIPLNQEQSLVARAARSGQGVVINDVQAEPGFLPHPLLPDTRAEMAVPLIAGEQVLGVLDVQSNRLNYFSKEDISTFTTLAAQTAVALQNARLFTQTEEREALLRTIIDATPDWIFIKDQEHRYHLVNQGYANALHITSEDFIGKNDLELGFPEELVKGDPEKGIRGFWTDDRLVMDSGQMQIYPDDPAAIDGDVHTFHTIKTPLRDADEQIWGVLAFARDITEHKRIEESLRRSEAELSEALRIAKLGYWEYDVEKDLFTFNDQFFALFHTTAEEHGGHQLPSAYYAQHFVHPDDLPIVGAEIEQALNSTDRFYTRSLEHRILYADGGVGYISVSINIERDEEGNILRYYGANQDITERKQAEEALRQSEGELFEALKIAKLAYWEYDVEKDLFTFNDQFFALFHTTAKEHGGYQLPSAYYAQHFVHSDDLPIVGAEIERALNSTERHFSRSLEHRILYADGGVGYLSVNINVERDEEGHILRYYGANQDITERKQSEVALRQSEAELSQALKIAKLAYWEYDVEKDLFTFNDQFFALFHTTAEAHGGHQLSSAYYAQHFVHPDDVSLVGAEIELAINSTDRHFSRSLEHRILYADGGLGYISVNINIERDEEGHILRWYGANQDITERREAQATITRRATELEAVANVSAVAATIVEPEELLQQVVDLTKARFDLYHAHIYLLDKDMDQLTLSNGAGDVGQKMVAEGRQIALSREKSLVARAARDKKGVVINDVQSEPGFLPHPLLPATRAEMAVPLIARDEVLGVLDVQADRVNRFMEEDINIFTTLAAQIAIALQNARSLIQSEKAVKELQELSRRLTREGWQEYFTERKDRLTYSYDRQQKAPVSEAGSEPTVFPEDARLITQTLQIQGASVGQLRLEISEQYGEDESELLTAVTERLSAHLENLRLAEAAEKDRAAAEKRSQEMAVINNIITQISTSLDLQRSLQTIVDELVPAVGVDQARVALMNETRTEMIVIAEHHDPSRTPSAIGASIPVAGNPLTQHILLEQQTVYIEDAQGDLRTAPVHDIFRDQGIQSIVIIPIIIGDEVIGTVGLDVLEKRPINAEKLQFAQTIVHQAATAVQNTRLFEQTQAALAETEMLYSYSSQLNTATNLHAVLESAAAPGLQVGATDAFLLIYNQSATDDPGEGQIMATVPKESLLKIANLYLPGQPFGRLWPSGGENILFVGNVEEDSRLSPADQTILAQHRVQALAIMFLTIGNLRLGQIVIRWDKHQTFTSADERLYGAIAQQASSVVYNRLLFNQTEEALSETAALYQASADLNTAQSYEQVLTALRQHTILGQGSNDVSLNFFEHVWEKEQKPIFVDVLVRWSKLPTPLPNRYKLTAFPEAETVLRPDEWLICEDVLTDERMGVNTREIFVNRFQARSLIYIPLVVGGQWMGFLSGTYPQPTQFPEPQVRRLNALARQAAVSIQSIRLYEQTQTVLAQTEALYTGSERIVLSNTEDDVLQALIQSTELRNLDRANLFMFDQPIEDGVPRDVTAVAFWEHENVPKMMKVGMRFLVEQVPFLGLLKPDASMAIPDIQQDERIDATTREIMQQFGMNSFVLFPLVVGSQWLGIVAGQSANPLHLDEVQLRQAKSLIGQAAVVMQTTLLFRQEQARSQRERLLREIATKVRSSTDVDTIMRTAVMEIGRTLGRRSFIQLGNDESGNGHEGNGATE